MTVAFLLGAGASKKAGVLLVEDFVIEFRDTLDPAQRRLLEKLEERLHEVNRVVDVEVILEMVETAKTLQNSPAAALLGRTQSEIGSIEDLARLGDKFRVCP